MRALSDCTALLFDGNQAESISRLYMHACASWTIHGNEPDAITQMNIVLDNIDYALRSEQNHIILSLSYEASQALSTAHGLHNHLQPQTRTNIPHTPWLQALAFDTPIYLNRAKALDWLKCKSQYSHIHLDTLHPTIDEQIFTDAIETIRTLIAAGDTYQVNYTFPLIGQLLAYAKSNDAALAALYHRLVEELRISYGALLTLPYTSVLSCSPELFFEITPKSLTCRPMKGTAAVTDNDVENTRRAAVLAADPKNRSENLMIVDLMRNDLSRLKQVKKVTVPKLFEVKRYGTVLQMTSTVKAHLYTQPSLRELLNALFPCGSITGAPKRRAMEIIHALEPHTRDTYCGALGFIEPLDHQNIHAIFNVPIRTIQTYAQPMLKPSGIQCWPLQLSVGAGITYDSNARDEWQESLLKAKFLTRHSHTFELIETMRVEQGQIALLSEHIARIQRSAAAFDWEPPTEILIKNAIQTALLNYQNDKNKPLRLRLTLNTKHNLNISISTLEPISLPARISLHTYRTDSINPFLQHKTSARTTYNEALNDAKQKDLFDYIFMNEKGEITEGARSNIFVRVHDSWYTPPLSCGLLPGIQRNKLIYQLKAKERILVLNDLKQASQIIVCNALYGIVVAQIDDLPSS